MWLVCTVKLRPISEVARGCLRHSGWWFATGGGGGVIVGNVYRVGWNIDLLLFYIRLVILFIFLLGLKNVYIYTEINNRKPINLFLCYHRCFTPEENARQICFVLVLDIPQEKLLVK